MSFSQDRGQLKAGLRRDILPRRLLYGQAIYPRRIEYEGALYHLFSRGNNQQDIFVADDDRYLFLDTTGQMSERLDNDIYAYVLKNY